MHAIGKRTKFLVGVAVVGAGAALTARAWKRWRARGASGLRTVARFGVLASAHRRDAGWEGLAGRALFKQLCAQLAVAGYPPSDHGDIEVAHECELFVVNAPVYLTMRSVDHEWEVVVSSSPAVGTEPGPPPKNTASLRRFLETLDQALSALEETEEIRWLRRADAH